MDNEGRVSTSDGPVRGAGSAPARDRWRFVPMVGWIRSYERRWLKGDLIAGVTVAALIVPKNLGYAGIAGIPLQNGLYAAAAGAILYAVFGTSRQISTGPSSGLAAVAASAVAVAGITGIQDVASFVAMITLVSGVLFLLLALLKMGWIAQFLSRAVVTGFLFGAAIDVVIAPRAAARGRRRAGRSDGQAEQDQDRQGVLDQVRDAAGVPPHRRAAEYFSAARARSGRASRTGCIRRRASSRLAGMYSVGQYPSCGR